MNLQQYDRLVLGSTPSSMHFDYKKKKQKGFVIVVILYHPYEKARARFAAFRSAGVS